MRTPGRAVGSLLVAGLLSLFASCGVLPGHSPAAPRLHALPSGSSVAVDAPTGYSPYSATFGAFPLCFPGASTGSATLDSVSGFASPASLAWTAMVHVVSVGDLAGRRGEDLTRFLPSNSTLGAPPGFDQPYAARRFPAGSYVALKGFKVGQSCAEVGAAQVALGRGLVPRTGYAELVFVVRSGGGGGRVDLSSLDYSASDGEHSMKFQFTVADCGSDAAVLPLCG